MGNDDWEYHHTTDSGHRVNEDGNDRYGHGHNYDVRPSSNSNSTSGSGNSSSRSSGSDSNAIVWLVGLGIGGFVVYKVVQFIAENWVTIVTILGTIIVCVIACIIISKKAQKPGLKIFLAIVASLGIMCALLYFGPANIGAMITNPRAYYLKITMPIQEKETIKYGTVTADVLNIRAKPSATAEVVGQFSKDDRIEITDDSNSWWLEVKFENSGGYVESTYVRLE